MVVSSELHHRFTYCGQQLSHTHVRYVFLLSVQMAGLHPIKIFSIENGF